MHGPAPSAGRTGHALRDLVGEAFRAPAARAGCRLRAAGQGRHRRAPAVERLRTAVGGKGDDSEFGLGFGKAGYYTLALNKAVGDSNALDVVAAPAGSDAWVLDGAGLMANGSARKSFSESGNTAPGAYKTISADLTVTPTINKLPELDLSNGGVALDGSATLELTYL
ncbi:hypothetical protein [Burkholderia cepacia]|uniref:Uncharacterized protein n=1 Tax=Burkholderia cepacia GG4 TaxID=1009846 RepID=A0A9W3JWT5_BURCE|nr:hypothetical protein [Burkholderia cepacia]AFQ46798.1 hypothetical protein GEM_0346 [Burkholderia cepacia GG4]